jgi:hypothetical protein
MRDAWGEDLHEPPAVPCVLAHDVLVGVPGFVADPEPRRTPVFSEPDKLVLVGHILPMPFSSLIPSLMIEHNRPGS